MAIPSAEASVIFWREDEGQGVGKRDRFLVFEAGCWWACEIADWVSSSHALMMAIDRLFRYNNDMKTQTEGK